jgi:hypothetical protein
MCVVSSAHRFEGYKELLVVDVFSAFGVWESDEYSGDKFTVTSREDDGGALTVTMIASRATRASKILLTITSTATLLQHAVVLFAEVVRALAISILTPYRLVVIQYTVYAVEGLSSSIKTLLIPDETRLTKFWRCISAVVVGVVPVANAPQCRVQSSVEARST